MHYIKKSVRAPCIIFKDLQSLIKKITGCKNKPEKLSLKKVGKHSLSDYSMSLTYIFDDEKSNYDKYRGKDHIENFCDCSKNHALNITNCVRRKWHCHHLKIINHISIKETAIYIEKNLKKIKI